MADEKESSETEQKKKAGVAIVLGCALTTLAITSEGPLKYTLFVVAIGMLAYGVFLGRRGKKTKPI
jgi:energy-converting hydrogenase Eha subunit H